ncbi:peptidylprolyl isomerase [Thermodesulfobacteriota bacterium]
MEKIENGLFVSVEYTGTLENGEVFDSSQDRGPLEVEIGAGQVISGFEDALKGMALNEKKIVTLEPEEAYGHRNENHIHTFPRTEMPPEIDPQVGQVLGVTTKDGREFPALITKADNTNVTVDLNHPLAGKALTFDIEVVGISNKSTQ